MQAIVTKYLGSSNVRGSRCKASSEGRSKIVEWNDALNIEDNHLAAAKALAIVLDWPGTWVGGSSPDGCGYVFVCVTRGNDPQFVIPHACVTTNA